MTRSFTVLFALGTFVVLSAFLGSFLPDKLAAEVDFVEYAAAARLLDQGQNPYDAEKLLALQQFAGWPGDKAQMMWNPPWVFPVVLPTAFTSWSSAFFGWDALQLVALGLSAVWCWRLYGGSNRLIAIPIILTLFFAPAIYLLRLGQCSGFLVLGLAGFLYARQANFPILAGMALSLTAFKPHLLLPFGLLLICDSLYSRTTRRAVLTGGLVLILAALFPMIWNPEIWPQFLQATRAPSDEFHTAPSGWDPPILANKLATILNGGLLVQFLPSGLASVVLLIYWFQHRREWHWARECPRVILVSLLTTGYGAWGFDLVLLLIPIWQCAAWLSHSTNVRLALWIGVGFLLFNAAILLGIENRLGLTPVLGWTPLVGLGYLLIAVLMPTSSRSDPSPVSPG